MVVRGCLEGVGELGDDNLNVWLEADVRPANFSVVRHELTSIGPQPAEDPTEG